MSNICPTCIGLLKDSAGNPCVTCHGTGFFASNPFAGIPHARANDPATSHAAVPVNLSEQAFRVLRAYQIVDPRAILDHEAYRLVGLDNGGRLTHQRCSDLRAKKMIERTDQKGQTPSGKAGYLSRITQRGRDYLKNGRDI